VRGFFAIGVYHPMHRVNIGTLWRSAYIFGAAYIFTIGQEYKKQSSDTMCAPRHIPLLQYPTLNDFHTHIPHDTKIICIENAERAIPLGRFCHPQRAIYLLGAEDEGLPVYLIRAYQTVIIPTALPYCLNVAVAGSLVMYHRFSINENKDST
jgi:tRNA(Leu) C34 or U34 (ribose-2'-O)-methylase TrmL